MNRHALLNSTFPMALALAVAISMSASTGAQQPEAEASAADTKAALSPLQTLEQAVQSDLNTQYQLLSQVSPRGVEANERAQMVRLLIELLDSPNPDIRARAASVLKLFGQDAVPAIPRLIKLLRDTEKTITYETVWVSASRTLAAIGPQHTLEPMMAAIPQSDRATYYGIAGAVAEMGEAAKSEAPQFIERLKDGPEDRRWATMFVLSKLGDAAAPAIPEYIKHLDHEEFNMQVIACRALAALGPAAKQAVPKLIELTGKSNLLSTRTHAAMCLGAIGPVANVDLVQIFTDMIEEPNAFSQERGLIALGRLGRYAENTRGFVEDLLDQPGFSQKPEAARTLWQITGEIERTLEVLAALIDNPTYDSRVHAILKEMGPAAAPLGGLVAEKLKTEDQSERQILVDILASMGKAAREHVGAIRGALEGAAPDTAYLIDRALATIEGE